MFYTLSTLFKIGEYKTNMFFFVMQKYLNYQKSYFKSLKKGQKPPFALKSKTYNFEMYFGAYWVSPSDEFLINPLDPSVVFGVLAIFD